LEYELMRKRNAVVVAVGLVGTVILAGCGSSSPAPAGGGGVAPSGGNAKTTVNVGVGTATFVAPLSTDSFAASGLELVQKPVNSGAAAIPLLLNGQLQFTAADSVGALQAISKNVPLVIVANATTSGSSAENDATSVFVKGDSPIHSAKDLAGKKVAVNGIGNTAQLSAQAAIDKLGGDSSKVQFVETPPPTLDAAVANGTVDAAVVAEPFITQGKAMGLRALFSPMAEALPSVPLFVYVTSQSYLAQHRDVVQKFAQDMVKANTYVSRNPDFVRNFAVQNQKLTPDQAAKLTLPLFVPPTVEKPAMQQVVDLMLKYKSISAPVDLNKAIFTP